MTPKKQDPNSIPDPLSDSELTLRLAREALKHGNSELAVRILMGDVPSLAPVTELRSVPTLRKAAPDAALKPHGWQKASHTCPQCQKSGLVEELFGWKLQRGVLRKQSWCMECRSKESLRRQNIVGRRRTR